MSSYIIKRNRGTFLKSVPLVKEIDGIMWRSIASTFISLYFCCLLLPALSYEEMFGRKLPRAGHGGFYDENQYDDGYAEYTGAEKRTFSEMQRRRFQDVQEDEPQEKRESIEDLLLRELTRGEYTPEETNDVEFSYDTPRKFSDFDDVRKEEDFDRLPEKRTKSDELKEQTLDGVGTASDDLALKREEEKQQMKAEKKKFSNLPADGELFEGDIIMDQRLRSWVTGQYDKRDAINDVSYMWPASMDENGKRIIRVPYTLSDEIQKDDEKMASINRAVESYNHVTCVRYVPATENDQEGDHVHFIINQTMCYSSVGRQLGKQDISIGNGCERLGTVLHEMMHTIGFIHEQSRPDRDRYVHVFYENIRRGLEHNFEKYTVGEVKTLPVNKDFYDFDSCLHYNNHAFSKNAEDTIQSLADPTRRFGQRKSFSRHDILQINQLYDCNVSNLHEAMRDISYD